MSNSCTSVLFKAPCTMGVLVHSFWRRMQDCARALKTQVGLFGESCTKTKQGLQWDTITYYSDAEINQLLFDISGFRILAFGVRCRAEAAVCFNN